MQMRILILSAALLLVGAICGQKSPTDSILLDETKPSVYIQYDTLVKENMVASGPVNTRLDATEKPQFGRGSQVRLQWFNNTRSAIQIPVTKVYSPSRSRVLGLDDDGKIRVAMRNGESISPCYRIAERPDTERLLRHDNWRFEFPSYKDLTLDTRFDRELAYCYHLHYGTRIAPGENVFFTVPRDYFAPNHILSVSFNYEWEERVSFGLGSVKHKVVFAEEDIQKAIGKLAAKEISRTVSTQKPSAMEMLLDKDRPSVYIQYFEPQKILENESRSQAEIKFWLFNNTRKAIRIPTERLDRMPRHPRPATLPTILEDGSEALAVRPGNRIYPCYTGTNLKTNFSMRIIRKQEAETKSLNERRPYMPFKSDCTLRSASWIASGNSVFFIVPRDRLELNDFFLLPFNYEWEKETDNIIHYITLAAYEIRN